MSDLLLFHLLRRYRWLFIALPLAGILWVVFFVPVVKPYWEWKGSIYCKAEFYDPMMQLTGRLKSGGEHAPGLYDKILNGDDFLRIDSYRNEDIYVFEFRAAVGDTSKIHLLVNWIKEKVEADPIINSRYFNRKNQLKETIRIAEATPKDSFRNAIDPLQYYYLLGQLKNQQIDLDTRFTINFPDSSTAVYIKPDRSRSFGIAIAFSLFTALALSFLLSMQAGKTKP